MARLHMEAGPHRKRLWKLIAFCARYGHQPVPALLRMPITDLTMFAEEVAQLIQDEARAAKAETDG